MRVNLLLTVLLSMMTAAAHGQWTVTGKFTIASGPSATITDNNYYDNVDGTCLHMTPTHDGPAALPTRCYNTAMVNTPSPGTAFWVCPSGQTAPAQCVNTIYNSIQHAFNDVGNGTIPCGSTIVIASTLTGTPAGTVDTYDETNLTYPAVACNASAWMTVESDQVASLPPEGMRVTPGWLGAASLPDRPAYSVPLTPGTYMPKIRNRAFGQPAMVFAQVNSASGPVASYVRFIGLNFVQPGPGSAQCATQNCQTGWQNSIVETNCFTGGLICPDHIIFDRVIVGADDLTGTATYSVCTGIRLTGTSMAVVDSYIYETGGSVSTCAESHGIGLGNANGAVNQGPYKIVDNFIETGAVNIFFGGGFTVSTPSDIQVRRNHLYKPIDLWRPGQPGYLGVPIEIKNLEEMKNALRVLIEGNIYENCWYGKDLSGTSLTDQQGFGVLLNAAAGSLTDLNHQYWVQDVTFRYNVVRHVVKGMEIDSEDCTGKKPRTGQPPPCGTYPPGSSPTQIQRISVHDNLFDDISPKFYANGHLYNGGNGGFDGSGFTAGNSMQSIPPSGVLNSVTINHNTVVSNSFVQNLTIASITVSGTTATLTATTASTAIVLGVPYAIFGACPGFNNPNAVVGNIVQTSPVLIFTYPTTATGSCNQGFVSLLGTSLGGSFETNEFASDAPLTKVSQTGTLAEALMTDIPPFQYCVAVGNPAGCTQASTFTIYGLTGVLACYNNNQSAATCPPSGTPATWTLVGRVTCTGAGTGNVVGNASAADCVAPVGSPPEYTYIFTWNHPMTGLATGKADLKSFMSYWNSPGPNPNPVWQSVVVTNNIFSGTVRQNAGICWNGPNLGPPITTIDNLNLCGVLATSGTGAYVYNCNVQVSEQLTGQGNLEDILPPGNSDTADETMETVGFVNYNSDNNGQGVVNLGDLALDPLNSSFYQGVPNCGGDGLPSGADNGLLQQYTAGVM